LEKQISRSRDRYSAGQTNDMTSLLMILGCKIIIDYIPQLYWSIDHRTASYAKLISGGLRTQKTPYIYWEKDRINSDSDKKWFNTNEIPNQFDLTRTYPNINGNAFF
jgi:hypothetical protein